MNKFDTHKFLYTLFHNKEIKGHEILFLDRENNEKKIKIKSIEIGASPVTCRILDEDNKTYRIPFIRIRKIFLNEKLVWDNTDTDLSNTYTIKGYD